MEKYKPSLPDQFKDFGRQLKDKLSGAREFYLTSLAFYIGDSRCPPILKIPAVRLIEKLQPLLKITQDISPDPNALDSPQGQGQNSLGKTL